MDHGIATPARLTAYRHLTALKAVCDLRGPDYVAGRIRAAGITGERDSTDHSPVGLWVLNELQGAGVGAVSYAWVGSRFTVYGADRVVLAAVVIRDGALHDTECLVNDLHPDFEDLARQGHDAPR